MASNKVVKKIITPYAIMALSIFAATSGFVATAAAKSIKNEQNPKEKKTLAMSASATIAVFALCLVFQRLSVENNVRKYNILFAPKYVNDFINRNPELKMFAPVLNNPRAMNNIANMTANCLTDKEIERVIEIFHESQQYKSSVDHAKKIRIAQTKITQLLKEHALAYPEFMDQMRIAIARADYMYIAPTMPTVVYSR